MIEKIIILCLSSIAICATTWEGMIFSKPAEWVENYIGVVVAKPLFGCYVCATIWYSALIALCLGWNPLLALPAMGLSAVISMLQND